jgi:2-polyprenyl-3-methyl-5-hydroxy-6-metoxy-1,4-benzoquinol methylase
MLQAIGKFVLSSSYHVLLLKTFIVLALLYFIVSTHSIIFNKKEGFEQREPFVFKQGTDVYDDFVIPAHEHIHHYSKTHATLASHIIKNTQASPEMSRMLDVGCGSGTLVRELAAHDMDVIGVDISKPNIHHCKSTIQKGTFVLGDITNPMLFEPASFTHIICTDFTLYELSKKCQFFQNCKSWLLPHGYLVLHLIDPAKFDVLPPASKLQNGDHPQNYTDERITSTMIDFGDFKYKSQFNFQRLDLGNVVHTETFTDKATHHVRQNEIMWYVQPEDKILTLAEHYGFRLKGTLDILDDPHQHIYILERGRSA